MHRVYRMVPCDQLKPNPRNARTHPQKQVREIAASIVAFGFTAPIITDENGKILAGHARYAAAQSLCLPEIPVVELHGLSDAKKASAGHRRQQARQQGGLGSGTARDRASRIRPDPSFLGRGLISR